MPRFGSDPREVVLALIASGMLDDVENDSIIVVTMGKSDSLPCIHGVKEFADAVDALAEKQKHSRTKKISEDIGSAKDRLAKITNGMPVEQFIAQAKGSKCPNCIEVFKEAVELLTMIENAVATKK